MLTKRLAYLDNLKVFLTALVVFSALYAVYRHFGKTVSGRTFRPGLLWLLP